MIPSSPEVARGVSGVLTENVTMAIKMQITSQTGDGLDLPFISLDNTFTAPAKTCASTHLRHNKTANQRKGRQVKRFRVCVQP